MKEIKIYQSIDIIDNFVDLLENSIMGLAFAETVDIRVEDTDELKKTMYITPKNKDQEINPADLFLFGYFVGRDYE